MTEQPETPTVAVQFITVNEGYEGQRIDNFLFNQLKGVPKSRIYKMLRKGECRVNKKRAKPTFKLSPGDVIRVPPLRVSEKKTLDVSDSHWTQGLEERILYEDERVIVVNKPSGLAVHGGSGLSFGLIESIRSLRPEQKSLELVHRLDRETSGCILIAKKRSALKLLHAQLREGTMDKRYHALVKGNWRGRQRAVEAPLLKNVTQSGERVVKVSREGKPSETRYTTLERFKSATLVEAYPVTGRTHQIRVHCLHEGHPIIGDLKYGGDSAKQTMQQLGVSRLFLHAQRLTFRVEADGDPITVEAPLGELQSMLEQLRAQAQN